MTELQLYKFIQDNNIEHNASGDKVILIIEYYHLRDWFLLIENDTFFDEGEEVYMCDYYIGIDIAPYCEYHGIDILNVVSEDCKKNLEDN